MSESRDHICPRCGSYLPTVRVWVPVYVEVPVKDGHRDVAVGKAQMVGHYEEREEVADCVRCTGSY
jgi:hypothetical protein